MKGVFIVKRTASEPYIRNRSGGWLLEAVKASELVIVETSSKREDFRKVAEEKEGGCMDSF